MDSNGNKIIGSDLIELIIGKQKLVHLGHQIIQTALGNYRLSGKKK